MRLPLAQWKMLTKNDLKTPAAHARRLPDPDSAPELPAHTPVPCKPRLRCQRLTRRPPSLKSGRRSVLSEALEAFVAPFKVVCPRHFVKGVTTRCGGRRPPIPQDFGGEAPSASAAPESASQAAAAACPYNARMADADRGERPAAILGCGRPPPGGRGRAPR